MTHALIKSLILLVLIVLCSGLAHSQQNSATSEQAANTALREKAFDLLESLAGEVNSLQSAENRARLGANIADSLWEHDEKRARALLASVADDIQAGLQTRDIDDPRDILTRRAFLKLRLDTAERIAKHDAESALAFLKATQPTLDKPTPYGIEDGERALEVRLAKQVAVENPELALELGRQALAQGFSDDLLPLLRQLHRKHRGQGVILYKEIVGKLQNANLAHDWNNMYFARSLADSLRPPAADDATFRDLINLVITNALANECDKTQENERAYLCSQMGTLMPHMQKVDPVRADRLKRWAREEVDWEVNQALYELNDVAENGTVEEILSLAAKYPRIDGQIHYRAMAKAMVSGDFERARKIATDYPRSPQLRKEMLDRIERYQKPAAVTDEELAQLQTRLNTTTRAEERLGLLVSAAYALASKDREAALKLLEQASGIVETMKDGREQTEAQLTIALAYCSLKSDRGFAIMESVVPKLNDLIAAAVKLDRYDNHYLRDGEWNMTGEGGLGDLLTRLAKNAGGFAWCDFDRSVSLAGQFERPEIRLMAQVKLAQGILTKAGSKATPNH